jgi:hypothetical protein
LLHGFSPTASWLSKRSFLDAVSDYKTRVKPLYGNSLRLVTVAVTVGAPEWRDPHDGDLSTSIFFNHLDLNAEAKNRGNVPLCSTGGIAAAKFTKSGTAAQTLAAGRG